ncbi:Inner membrane transport protein YajR [Bacillus subtilis]|uniref:MFS transporter n=1 Tax=Bacillus subtilis TaxID=1423 RepID=UPI000956BCA9|nr:MFS transporter [Bacillus subtilis]CAF1719505.1 Inner membrane transport protein YajR [Bacillus subtilis]SIP98628.1 Predicted arabinose efflux permease, MFS family [Bacillus subtilis]
MELQQDLIPQKKTIGALDHAFFLCMVFCFWFSGYIYVPVFSLYLEDLHFSYGAIGIILGSYGVTQILLRFPLGLLSDILFSLRKQLLIAVFGFSVLSSLLFLMFDSFFFVLAARLFAGITASTWVMATILYAHYFNNGNASKAMGIMQFFTVMPQFASIVFCGLAAAHLGRQVPFWMAMAASVAGLVFCCFIKDPSAPPANRGTIRVNQYIKDTLRLPKLKLFTILSITAHAVLFITVFGFTPLYMNQLGMGDAELLWVMSAFFLPHAAATLSFVFLRFTSRIAYFVMLISFAVTGVCLLYVPFSAALFTVCITHACIGLALGFVFPLLLSHVVEISSARLKMSVMGFYQSFYALGIFLGPLLAGKIAQLVGLAGVFYGAGSLAFAAFFVMLAQKRNMIN